MLQVLQNLGNGETRLEEVPAPAAGRASVLIRSRRSLISAGTERMLLEFGKAGWIEKARQQPDKVRMVLDKIRTDGLAPTLESVRAKLDQPIPLGYSNAGVVLCGDGFAAGTRVVSNGAHAEIVRVAKNLCARIPDGVSDEAACFTVIGAIALEGIRLAQPTLGETFAVTGLGLIGLVAVQLLRAHGCRVIGIDFDPQKLALARRFGAETVDLAAGEDPVRAAEAFSRGRGLDGVLITAATKSNEPVHQAALMCRKRGRIVLTGVTGLELSRDDFYKKELSFQVSCSYGPGRYDSAYESGQDYPVGYVRWTAQRNFEAVLDMMADGRLDVGPLVTHRFPLARACEGYELIQGSGFYLGVVLEYDEKDKLERKTTFSHEWTRIHTNVSVGFVGAGGYGCKVLIPAFKKAGVGLVSVGSSGGVSAAVAGRKFGFAEATTDIDGLMSDERINTVVIATRHDSHADLVCQALRAGKHVFVEKPLALTTAGVDEIESVYAGLETKPLVMVGFNRRFAPQVVRMKELLRAVKGPKAFVYTVNAGSIPGEHWTQHREVGGGRIIGEACHFVDLLRFLAGCSVVQAEATELSADTVSIQMRFEDGSIGTVHYFANGHKGFPKERVEVFCGGRILALDNFRKLSGYGWKGFGGMRLWSQDKGAEGCVAAFVKAVREGGVAPIPFAELIEVSRVTIQVSEGL